MSTPTVEPLDITVYLAKLPCTAVPQALYHLLQLAFFCDEEPRFLSITVVEATTITIITEGAAMASLAEAVPALVQDDVEWAVVRVAEGSSGYESVGVVERLTEPLAQQRIPVLYTSTYSMDYCLIPQSRLNEAIDYLASQANEQPIVSADLAREPSRHTYPLTVMGTSVINVYRIDKHHRQRHTGALLRLLLIPQQQDAKQAIVSLVETAEEISLLASDTGWWSEYFRDADHADGLHVDPNQGWVPIRVGDEDGTPLEETGVIASQAKVLADANLSSTFAIIETRLPPSPPESQSFLLR